MYIFSNPPSCMGESSWIERSLRIGDCFDVLLHNKATLCSEAFRQLVAYGITLSEETSILVQFYSRTLWTADFLLKEKSVRLVDQIFAIWSNTFDMHLFTSDGYLYGLLTPQKSFRGELLYRQVNTCCDRLIAEAKEPGLSILISQDEQGTQGIFHAANSLRNAVDYLRFFDEVPRCLFVNIYQQMAPGEGEELAVYRRLAQSLAERLREKDFCPECSAQEILDTLRNNCHYSIEVLHNQMQSFNLIFLTYLISHGLVDEDFLRAKMIRQRIKGGDQKERYLSNLAETLRLLYDRYRELCEKNDIAHLNRVQDYVQRHIGSASLSVSLVAEHFHVNRSQLTRQFREYTGQSLAEYIFNIRLDLAMLLMESHPNWTMEQVAQKAGYYSLSTMYRAFQKKELGPPAQYQRRFTKQ